MIKSGICLAIRRLFILLFLCVFMSAILYIPAFAMNETEGNNSFETANSISVNTEVYGSIEKSSDVDWYVFQIPSDGSISITFDHNFVNSSNSYWKTSFYTSENKELENWTWKGNTTSAETGNEIGVAAGTYYVRVSAYNHSSETYHFTVNYAPSTSWEKEFNETLITANAISVNTGIFGTIRTSSDVDWYVFQIPSDGSISITFSHNFVNSSSSYWKTSFYTSENKELENWTWKGNTTSAETGNEIGVAAGTYYLRVSAYNHSPETYNFTVNYTSSTSWEKEFNETLVTANAISVNTEVFGTIRTSSDVDWYVFQIPSDGSISITFGHNYVNSSSSYWRTSFYTSENKELENWTWKGNTTSAETGNEIGVPADTYYLRVSAYNHSPETYNFTVNYTPSTSWEKEFNETLVTANAILVNTEIFGTIRTSSDVDWYVFEIPEDDMISLTFDHNYINSSSYYWRTSFYTSENKELETWTWKGNTMSAETGNEVGVGAGTYYLRVSAYNHSPETYHFTVNTVNYKPSSNPATDSSVSEYIYNTTDPGGDAILDTERLNEIKDPASAVSAVQAQAQSMTAEQKDSVTGADLATLYAETAVAKAASREVEGNEITINAAAVADLETVAAKTSSAVETALVNGGITTARIVSNTITLTTDETGEISIRIDPDILTTSVDKIRVETPTYALTLKVAELEPDLTGIITITAQDVGSGYATGNQNRKTTVQVNLPQGKTTNPVTISLPTDSGDITYQAVVKNDGTTTSSKYNPSTTTLDGKITTSGTYTVQTNQKDFTDIANKSAEMQSAIRYLASKGIINGDTDTTFSPDASISRAEIAALIVRALGKLDSSATNSFTDVTTANWYYSAAGSSQRLGIITGYEDNTFRGTTAINKEQIVAVAARVLISEMNYKTPSNTSTYLGKYSDTVVSWAQPQVALATKENLVVYRTDGTFSGAKDMTRGDAAIIIYRLFQKIW